MTNNQSQFGARLTYLSGILIFFCGFCVAIVAAWLMVIGYSPTPFADHWEALFDLSTGKRWNSLGWLWQQHNEHRIPLFRLALIADLKLFGGYSIFLFVLIYATLVLHWSAWVTFIKKTTKLPGFVGLSIMGCFAICIFFPTQIENFYWAFQWAFVSSFFFASISFLCLVWWSHNGQGWRAVIFASLAALAAESSLASGLVAWPILWLAAIRLPLSYKQRGVLAAFGLTCLAAYFYHYQSPAEHSSPLSSVRQPGRVAQYLLTYLGHCFSAIVNYPSFAVIALSLLAACSLVFLFRQIHTRALAFALSMTMSFVVGTGVITALGRLKFGVDQATASRYQTPVMLYWACVFTALIVAAANRSSWRDVLTLNLLGITVILLPLNNLVPLAKWVRERAEGMSSTGESLDRGVVDRLEQAKLMAAIGAVQPAVIYLHSIGDGAGPKWVNVPSASFDQKHWDRNACAGWFDATIPLTRFFPGPKVFRAEGWAIDLHTNQPASLVALVDDQGRFVSASAGHFSRADVLSLRRGANGLVGWRLYAPVRRDARELKAFAIVDGKPCPLQTTQSLGSSLINGWSGKALQVPGSSLNNGVALGLGPPQDTDNQKWLFAHVDGNFVKIVNEASGDVIDVTGRSVAPGAVIQQFEYLGGDNQKWELLPIGNSYYALINKGSKMALEVVRQGDQLRVQQSSYNAAENQRWKISPAP